MSEAEALSSTRIDMLRNNITTPQTTPVPLDARRAKIEQRAAALIAEEFRRNPPANAWWGDAEVAVRDRCFEQAQIEVATEMGIEAWRPKNLDADQTDWSVPPRMGLKLAINERRVAAEFRGKAGQVAARASDMLVALELELSQFNDLDQKVDECRLQQARDGNFNHDLPYSLVSALRDRDLIRDRLDHARRASDKLQGEFRAAEQALQAKDRIISAWATRLLSDHADSLADELDRVRAEYEQRRSMLYALTFLTPTNSIGPIEVSRKLHEALSTSPQQFGQSYDQLRPMVEEWSRAHAELTVDPDGVIEVA